MSDLAEPLSPHEPEPTTPASASASADGPPSPDEAAAVHPRVELRVHGVSGGQAEELLDVEPAVRVGGDRLAGFFRWRREADTETVPGVRREIFAWGNLTSGSSSRALWLLLLPFMLVNVAYWMRPGRMDRAPTGVRRLANNAYGAGVRLLALSLTALISLAAAGIGMDLVAWQCAAWQGEECVRARPWLAFLGSPSSVLSAPGPALVVGAAVPLAVIVVLWLLSRRTGADYEVVDSAVPPRPGAAAPLSHTGFWRNSETMARLRSAHVSVALGTVVASMLIPALRHDLGPLAAGPPGGAGPWTVGLALAALVAVVVTASTLSVLVPGTEPRWNARADRMCRLLRDATAVLGLAVVGYTLWPRPEWAADGRMPGSGAVLNTLFAAQAFLVAMMLAAALVLFLSDRAHGDTAMGGLAGPATAALGALLGGGFSAAVVYQASLLLSGCGSLAAPEVDCLPLSVPTAYSWLQLAFALEAGIALAAVAALALGLRRGTRAQVPRVTEYYARSVRDRRTWEIARARAAGRMTETLPSVLVALLLPVVALGVLVLYSTLTGELAAGPASAATAVSEASGGSVQAREAAQAVVSGLIGTGSILGGLALAALAWIGRSAYRDRPTRQAVGSLWDVGTFWPRVAHPLAPPSYAERAVPQLCARVALMCREGTDVVLSGHSQGSVLAAATVWQLPTDCLGRVALLTHGSPLDRLYARYFPAYFGPEPFGDLRERVSAWHNLWRVTDAIAGPVRVRAPSESTRATRTVEWAEPLPDPRSYDALPGEARRPEIRGHSHYTADPAYSTALRRVLATMEEAEVRGADPTEGAKAPRGTAARPGGGYQGP